MHSGPKTLFSWPNDALKKNIVKLYSIGKCQFEWGRLTSKRRNKPTVKLTTFFIFFLIAFSSCFIYKLSGRYDNFSRITRIWCFKEYSKWTFLRPYTLISLSVSFAGRVQYRCTWFLSVEKIAVCQFLNVSK